MYIVLRVPYTCNFIAIDSICKISIVEAIKYQNKGANRFAVLTVLCFKDTMILSIPNPLSLTLLQYDKVH